MMKKNKLMPLSLAILAAVSCNPAKKTEVTKEVVKEVKTEIKKIEVEEVKEPTPVVPVGAMAQYSDSIPVYRATTKRENDLIHSTIDVRFDWKKRHCLGKITITAKPYFYETDVLELDAKGMEILKVEDADRRSPLQYSYKDNKLTIQLGRIYTRNDQYRVFIEYIGKPDEAYKGGGSTAILSDKGLFFINPDGTEANKPTQIWTQGETESNSHWFPTVDKPNERMTSDVNITVDKKYKTLSNGVLTTSRDNGDGTRTDAWKMNQPHAPYLVMMAVGEFAVVTEKWRGKDVMYYVEPKFEKYAKQIYKNTPELLTFFSDKLGVEFPWQKYAQVTVRDYVSGAMENTTAVIFGEFMNGTDRDLVDNDFNEIVVAHEMFHHWFGDLVTCESWSNLTVNESFANYSESLWFEHKYGTDFGDHSSYEAMMGYFGEASGGKMHNLVDFRYNSREDMFDAHSYNKGGCILHQLRKYVGDEAFFASLKKYLTQHAYSTGEAHQLRLAFEEVTGEDLNWFFNQWYFKSGHPEIEISYNYDEAAKKMKVTIVQNQTPSEDVPNVFELPMAVDIYADGKKVRKMIRMTKRNQVFEFDAPTKPNLVNVDAEKSLVGLKIDNHSDEEWAFMFQNGGKYLDRREALEAIGSKKTPLAKSIVKAGLSDKFWAIRELATQMVAFKDDPTIEAQIEKMATSDNRSQVRIGAIRKLTASKDSAKMATLFRQIAERDFAYSVVGAAMKATNKMAPAQAADLARANEKNESPEILGALADIYSTNPSLAPADFFEKNIAKVDGANAIDFMDTYGKSLMNSFKANPNFDIVGKLTNIKNMATDQTISLYKRFGSTKALYSIYKKLEEKSPLAAQVKIMLDEIREKETSDQLKSVYSTMFGAEP